MDITSFLMGKKSGGSGGTADYNELSNKPQINSVELSGNKSLSDLGINSGATVNFITQGNEYTRPFILEDAEPGVYGLQQDTGMGIKSQTNIYLKTTSSSNYFTINNPVEPYIYVVNKYSDDLPKGTIIAWINTLSTDESLNTKVLKKSNSNNGITTYDYTGFSRYVKDNQIESLIKKITGFDATKTQVLKNINGTLTWVDE